MAYVWHRSRIVAIDFLLSFDFAVVFNFNVYPFPQSKAQFLGNVYMNSLNCKSRRIVRHRREIKKSIEE